MLLQAALNGPFTSADHPAVPMSIEEMATDAAACVVAGAGAIHVHPRDGSGRESLAPAVVNRAAAIRAAANVPVGVSTGAWIEPDLTQRLDLISKWTAPDYASVNVSEPGAEYVIRALLAAGVGVEAGVWDVGDAERLVASGLAHDVLRVLVEPVDVGAEQAVGAVAAIHDVLDDAAVAVPRLQHGDGAATWVLIDDARRRGLATRVGFEDTLRLRDGGRAASNAALVAASTLTRR